ncbi:MAG: hypothetical protein IJD33_01400 [Clostridia bacterium]|nr:hypothetical protein [Clostridia bacterium]
MDIEKAGKIMQEDRKRLLKSVYAVCFSVLTAVVGLLFIVQTWSIFRSAERAAFTRQSISQHFKQIAVPVILWGLALFVNIALGYMYPDQKERVKPYFTTNDRIKRLQKRLPKDAESLRRQKTDTVGGIIGGVAAAFALTAVIVSLVYLFDKSYTPVLNETIFAGHNGAADRLVRVLLWCSGGMLLMIAAVLFDEYFARKKEEKIKHEIAENAAKGIRVAAQKEEKKSWKHANLTLWIVRGVVAVVGIMFVITGIANGGMADVLKKAINICTQCIGLG